MQEKKSYTRLPFHYGWLIMVSGTLCIFACLGLGRFSLGMLLPSMGSALGLSYSEMGLISTSNFVGYLAAVLLSSRLVKIFGARKVIGFALLLVGFSMISIGRADNLYAIIFFYILTGMGSAFANISIMALISIWFSSHIRGKASGFVVIGSGFAIILSGQLIPFLNSTSLDGWRISWFTLGSIVLVTALICSAILRNSPEEQGLLSVGAGDEKTKPSTKDTPGKLNRKIIWHCGCIYFLFGFTYVIYATFIVTSMVQERGFPESTAGTFWSWIGLLSLLSGPVLGAFSDKFGRKAGLITVFSIQSVAYLLAALSLSDFFLFLSIGCYGLVVWSVPSIISALVGDIASQQRVAAVFGFVTFIFGIGQISGPFLAGVLAEKSGSFSGSFAMASCLTFLAVILSALLPNMKK